LLASVLCLGLSASKKRSINIAELRTTKTALKYFATLEVWCLKWRMFTDG